MQKTIFDQFTRKYSFSKTLRFELKPKWSTLHMLDAESVIKNDELRRKKYEAVKPWFDKLHRELINDSLKDFNFKDLKAYQSALNLWQSDKKSKQNKESFIKIENELREELVECFEKTANKWAVSEQYKTLGLKKDGVDMLFEAGVFKLLKERFKDEKETQIGGNNIFDDWNKWTGYFKKFFETRKNFYKSDDTSTAVAYRIVNQNLRRFCENIQIFKKVQNKIIFSEVEKNFNVVCGEVFSLENYNRCLLQEGIDFYNKIIGGELRERNEKIQGLNELINKYRQDNPDEKIPFLKTLNKQIHSEKEAFIENIETDGKLIERLGVFYKNTKEKIQTFRKLINDIASDYSLYDLKKIYLSKEAILHNANRWFEDYELFEKDLFAVVSEKQNKQEYELLRTHKNDSKISDKEGKLTFPDFIKCLHIKQALDKQEGMTWKEKYYDKKNGIENIEGTQDKFKQFLYVFKFEFERQLFNKTIEAKTGKQIEVGYNIFSESIKNVLSQENKNINSLAKIDIKNFADAALNIYHMAKYFAVEKRRNWLENYDLDDSFYKSSDFGYLNFYQDAFEQIVSSYNLFRNYLTKKPYSTNKWVLNFENQTLADGWDKGKEKDNAAVIFSKDGRYYLGIMHRNHKDIFTNKYRKTFEGNDYKKMVYRQIANPAFDIYNLVLLEDGSAKRFTKMENKIKNWPDEIIRIKEKKSYAKENFNRSDFQIFVDYIKKCAINYWKEFTFSFNPTNSYNNINDFTKEIENAGYKISFDESVSEQYLRDKNQKGELFVFEIHNKDWNLNDGKKKTSAKNLHTLYFEQLFSDENAQNNFLFKLNGEAELFFRPATDVNKLGYREKDGKILVNKKGEKIIKNYRYSKDKIFFHCPITVNRVSENKTEFAMNTDIREAVANNSDVRIVGVDRGEKNLIYYSVIDQGGKIIDMGSLNSIGRGESGTSIEYAAKLEKRAQEREASRRDWADVEAIKDIKRGYISQAIKKLAKLIIDNNAIIVFEDLNMRFKQIRGGFEKSVYQQLEKALIDKLSFLVKKGEKDLRQAGHILRAYQLAAPIKSFKDMGKQTGVIFYTQAGYTSRTCPECGYRRNIKCRFENIKQANGFMENLNSIVYNQREDIFEIRYSLSKISFDKKQRAKKPSNELYEKIPQKDDFILTTKGALRYKWYDRYSEKLKKAKRGVNEYKGEVKESETKKGIIKEFNITEYIKGLLETTGIDYYKHNDIKQQILLSRYGKEFYQDFLYALFLLTETRHSISGADIDYIQCPSCSFDGREGFQGQEYNGDANGAYNIARKGIMILEKIKQYKNNNDNVEKMSSGDLSVSVEEWDKFTQK